MNLTIWQFLGIVLALLVIYLIYNHWWANQDNRDWIQGFNTWVFSAESDSEPVEEESDSSGWIE